MDEKYKEFLSIKPLLDENVAYRTNKELYQKILRETYIAEMENLRNVEIEICNSKPKLVDPNKWPVAKKVEIPEINAKEQPEEYNSILTALNYLK